MKRIISKILLLASLAFVIVGCELSPDYLREESKKGSNDGNNVVSFTYNDVLFIAQHHFFDFQNPSYDYACLHLNDSKDSVHVHANIARQCPDTMKITPKKLLISIALSDLRDGAVITDKAQYVFEYLIGNDNALLYAAKPQIKASELKIRHWDSEKFILSGNFSLNGYLEYHRFILKNGNFDVTTNKYFND